MRRQRIILSAFVALAILCGCDDNNQDLSGDEDHKHDSEFTFEKIEEFKIPDSVNNSLMIAAYDEWIPQEGRTILVYDDSTRTTVTKISYLEDSTVRTEVLIKLRDDEFRSKITSATYRITTNYVYYGFQTSSLGASCEYIRMDNFK